MAPPAPRHRPRLWRCFASLLLFLAVACGAVIAWAWLAWALTGGRG